MKPKNFPARKLARQKRAGESVTEHQIAVARTARTKKQAKNASTARQARLRGKIAR